jgi:ABC-type glutathione transport system ATPase component
LGCQRITEVLRAAKAVVMVTHDLSCITEFCNRAILLGKGRIVADGDPETVAAMHTERAAASKRDRRRMTKRMEAGDVPVTNVRAAQRRRETIVVPPAPGPARPPDAAPGTSHGDGSGPEVGVGAKGVPATAAVPLVGSVVAAPEGVPTTDTVPMAARAPGEGPAVERSDPVGAGTEQPGGRS